MRRPTAVLLFVLLWTALVAPSASAAPLLRIRVTPDLADGLSALQRAYPATLPG